MIYVDTLKITKKQTRRWKYPFYAHMVGDTEKELITFAQSLGLREEWIQRSHLDGIVHFDLNRNLWNNARKYGAKLLKAEEWRNKLKEIRKGEEHETIQ